jgi:thiamine-phosphate pyrophosphorylase
MFLPKLYPIIDKATLDRRGIAVGDFARELAAASVGIVQYRDKVGSPQEVLRAAAEITAAFAGRECSFVMNDRADLAALAGWGVHVGQGDLSPEDARRVLQATRIVGLSTHNEAQVESAISGDADYIAIGPVFATSTKRDAEPVVGLEGVRRARSLTERFTERRALVAIGGITLENARSVVEAGADSVAVIGGLFVEGRSVGDVVEAFVALLA